jgi:MFS family permease
VIPVIIAILCLSKVKNPGDSDNGDGKAAPRPKPENPFQRKYLKSLDGTFWKLILLAFISEMGHFSEHIFPLYANNFLSANVAGSASSFVSMGQVLLCFPIGILADRYGKRRMIAVCMCLMILANLAFISAKFMSDFPIIGVYAGAFLWGGQTTAVQGIYLSLISERVNFHLRATAMGIYFLMLGASYFTASDIAGKIWDNPAFGSTYAFLYSMFFSCLALALLRVLLPKAVELPYGK